MSTKSENNSKRAGVLSPVPIMDNCPILVTKNGVIKIKKPSKK